MYMCVCVCVCVYVCACARPLMSCRLRVMWCMLRCTIVTSSLISVFFSFHHTPHLLSSTLHLPHISLRPLLTFFISFLFFNLFQLPSFSNSDNFSRRNVDVSRLKSISSHLFSFITNTLPPLTSTLTPFLTSILTHILTHIPILIFI